MRNNKYKNELINKLLRSTDNLKNNAVEVEGILNFALKHVPNSELKRVTHNVEEQVMLENK